MKQFDLVSGIAQSSKTRFRMECRVSTSIQATPEKLWSLLTNAQDFTSWNTTVVSIDGPIELNKKIKLKSTLDPKRTFHLKISEMLPSKKMVWEDGVAPLFKGVRTFTLEQKADDTTEFSMVEVFSGLMLPLIAGSLPDFKPSFEKYAKDLKARAERK